MNPKRHLCTKCRKKRKEKFLTPIRDSDKPGSKTWICVDDCSDGRLNVKVQSYLQEGQSNLNNRQSNGYQDNVHCGHKGQSTPAVKKSNVPVNKFILDACCGNRMFWFNKKHPHTLYIDIKSDVDPDEVQDFKDIKYKNNSFNLVVWDPPHIFEKSGNYSWLNKKYGSLKKDSWILDLKQGFDECMRVLKNKGILIFKWSEGSISVSTILSIIQKEPLFGHTSDKKNRTHWLCFMKIE